MHDKVFKCTSVVFVLLLLGLSALGQSDPDPYNFIEPCQNVGSTIDECLLNMTNTVINRINDVGIPELNVTKPEPLKFALIEHKLDFSLVTYYLNFTNINAAGASALQVKRVRANPNRLRFEADIVIPQLIVNSTFTSFGDFFGNTINGGGICDGVFENVNSYIRFKGKPINRDGKVYISVDSKDFLLDYTINKVQLEVSKLKSNNDIFKNAFNLYLSLNAQQVVEDAKPQMKHVFQNTFLGAFNKLLNNVPLRHFIEGTKYVK